MSEETAIVQPEAATSEEATQTPADDAEAGGSSNGTAVDTPEWTRVVESVDPNDLRKHPRVAGIVGDMVDKAVRQWVSEQQVQVSRQAAQRTEAELMDMATRDPIGFSKRFLNDKEAERYHMQLASIQERARQEFAGHIGKAYEAIPEAQLTVQDRERLAKAIAGKTDDGVVLAAYNAEMANIIADKRTAKATAEFKEKELPARIKAEREALRAEEAAKLRAKSGDGPGIARGRSAPTTISPQQIKAMPQADFDKMYAERYLSKL